LRCEIHKLVPQVSGIGAHAGASVGGRPMTSTSTTIPTFTPSTLEAMRAHGVESTEFIETASSLSQL